MQKTKKNKIINDPIYGFITLERGIIFDLIEHPFFQRLRRITQLGLSYLVYPGAYHTRFHHALGCMFLMEKAIFKRVLSHLKIAFFCVLPIPLDSILGTASQPRS